MTNEQSRQPKKPNRPLDTVAFSDTGKVRLVHEDLPRTQKELEAAIGAKFFGSLTHFKQWTVTDFSVGDGRGDVIVQAPTKETIKVQIVEAIDHTSRQLGEVREDYSAALTDFLQEHPELFQGCRLSFVPQGTTPFLPRLRTKNGKMVLAELIAKLSQLGSDILSLEPGWQRCVEWQVGLDSVIVSVLVERFIASDSGVPPVLHWGGGRAFEIGEQPGEHVLDAILAKIAKNYSKPREEFWLLVYSTESVPDSDGYVAKAAKVLLNTTAHPFDAVWLFCPYPNRELGHVVLLWGELPWFSAPIT
ncbi:MAG: hypothetical protein NW224_06820 [Leptolyngbyaceae cyanobacterium bins.302]|nr:hypothetical protein [Leptolyngbyaceae cyanobacterium bins.302]